MAKSEDLTGCEFGFLKVLGPAPDKISKSGKKVKMWECECLLCGNKKDIRADAIRSTKSCGCLVARKGAIARNKKNCVICGKEFACRPSRNVVTCSQNCKLKYLSQNHKGLKHTPETRDKMSKSRLANERCEEMQKSATEAAKISPKSGRFETNIHAMDWHLVSPEGDHYYFHSLNFWLRENCENLFGFAPDSKEFYNAISGLGRAKRSVMGKIPKGQRPGYSYKGWHVLPTDDDYK